MYICFDQKKKEKRSVSHLIYYVPGQSQSALLGTTSWLKVPEELQTLDLWNKSQIFFKTAQIAQNKCLFLYLNNCST